MQSSSTTAVATRTKNHVHKNMTVFLAWYKCVYRTWVAAIVCVGGGGVGGKGGGGGGDSER